jgi:hypothetical protein
VIILCVDFQYRTSQSGRIVSHFQDLRSIHLRYLLQCSHKRLYRQEFPIKDLKNVNNQRKYLDWAAKHLNVKEMKDWYKVTSKVHTFLDYLTSQEFVAIGGANILSQSGQKSTFSLLSTVYPEHEWLPWKFSPIPNNFWDDVNNQHKFITWASKHLNIKDMSDWYEVSYKVTPWPLPNYLFYKNFCDLGGSTLLIKYNYSPRMLLSTLYPDYEWLPWKFKKCPASYWDNMENQRKFMYWAAKQLNIKETRDWYKVTAKVTMETENSSNNLGSSKRRRWESFGKQIQFFPIPVNF